MINSSLSAYQAARSKWIEPLLLISFAAPAFAPERVGPSGAAGVPSRIGPVDKGGEYVRYCILSTALGWFGRTPRKQKNRPEHSKNAPAG